MNEDKQNNKKGKFELPADLQLYTKTIVDELNDFFEAGGTLSVVAAIYQNSEHNQVAMIKLEFSDTPKEIGAAEESLEDGLKHLPEVMERQNYYMGNNIYIIRPNQDIFWTKEAAEEDAREITGDIVKMQWERVKRAWEHFGGKNENN